MAQNRIDVLDHGFVRLVDWMGNDTRVAQSARVSYGEGTRPASDDDALIDYLMRHRHTSPFEMVVFLFHIKLPIFVARQLVRHRTASLNEVSARYSILPNDYYVPRDEQLMYRDTSNKQAQGGVGTQVQAGFARRDMNISLGQSFDAYQNLLDDEVPRELARIVVPTAAYTEMYWQMDLHNLLHFLKLRTDSHAQWEIQQYANAIEKFVAEKVPVSYSAWRTHVKEARTFSRDEMKALGLDTIDGERVAAEMKYMGYKHSRISELLDKL